MIPNSPSESGTDRDGFLSYYGEWHAFTVGIYRGLTVLRPWEDKFSDVAAEYDDVDAEPWYYHGGYTIGTLIQAGFIILLLAVGLLFPSVL